MALDKVPGKFNIYIGGFISLRRKDALKAAHITHVASVVDWPIDADLLQGYKHLSIQVNDVEDEKLINHFSEANHFIQDGLDSGGGVLVHCAMGKSRSAAICIAFLLWKSEHGSPDDRLDPDSALAVLRQSRPLCEPNDGFMEQLRLYHEIGCPDRLDDDPRYQRWLYKQALQENLAIGRAPDMHDILFEDEHEHGNFDGGTGANGKQVTVKCRKCRQTVADSSFIIDHQPPDLSVTCGHLYVQPLSWMRNSLQTGSLEGRLTCPNSKCNANIGKFAWQGQKCSCGQWMTPAFSLVRGKVDEVTSLKSNSKIRQPPSIL